MTKNFWKIALLLAVEIHERSTWYKWDRKHTICLTINSAVQILGLALEWLLKLEDKKYSLFQCTFLQIKSLIKIIFLELHEIILRVVKKYSVDNLQIKTTNVRKILYGSIWSHITNFWRSVFRITELHDMLCSIWMFFPPGMLVCDC